MAGICDLHQAKNKQYKMMLCEAHAASWDRWVECPSTKRITGFGIFLLSINSANKCESIQPLADLTYINYFLRLLYISRKLLSER